LVKRALNDAVQMGTTPAGGQNSIFNQISDANLRTVDGFVRHSGLVANAELKSGGSNPMGYDFSYEQAKLATLKTFWDKALGDDVSKMKILDTAWVIGSPADFSLMANLSGEAVGPKQAGAAIKLFSMLIASGSDSAAIWGVQDKMSFFICQDGTQLSYVGHSFRIMAETLAGTEQVANRHS